MNRAEAFIFDKYEIVNGNEVHFSYQIEFADTTEQLVEKWVLPATIDTGDNTGVIERVLEAIHIAAGISYYKAFIPFEIKTKRPLSDLEADFWNTVYDYGLREFCYVNKIDFDLAKFKSHGAETSSLTAVADNTAVLGIGGGKDSIVAGELLRAAGLNLVGFGLDTGSNKGQIAEVSEAMEINTIHIERYLDKRLFELAKERGGLSGHIPISVLFALSGILTAAMTNSRFVAAGNEAGASIPNLTWNGKTVNHQWSKSIDFEKLFQDFVHKTISDNITYFSPIRPFSSVAITKLFCDFPQYLPVFTSCNYVLRIDPAKRPKGRWCLKCDKCLSSFILFSAWLPEETVIKTFGSNMFDDSELESSLLALLGLGDHKPLNCVGTPEELLSSYARLRSQGKYEDSALVKLPQLKKLPPYEELETFLVPYDDDAIPEELRSKILEQFSRY